MLLAAVLAVNGGRQFEFLWFPVGISAFDRRLSVVRAAAFSASEILVSSSFRDFNPASPSV